MFDRHLPAVIWAQRNDKLYVTINVEDCQNAVVNFDDSKLTFRYFISSGCLFGYCWILLYFDVLSVELRLLLMANRFY